jgi:hypothetical protein
MVAVDCVRFASVAPDSSAIPAVRSDSKLCTSESVVIEGSTDADETRKTPGAELLETCPSAVRPCREHTSCRLDGLVTRTYLSWARRHRLPSKINAQNTALTNLKVDIFLALAAVPSRLQRPPRGLFQPISLTVQAQGKYRQLGSADKENLRQSRFVGSSRIHIVSSSTQRPCMCLQDKPLERFWERGKTKIKLSRGLLQPPAFLRPRSELERLIKCWSLYGSRLTHECDYFDAPWHRVNFQEFTACLNCRWC